MEHIFLENLKQEYKIVLSQEEELQRKIAQAPKGSLHILKARGKYPQYYNYDASRKKTFPNGIYIKKRDRYLAELLAQKEYDENLLKEISCQRKGIEKLIEQYTAHSLQNAYDMLDEQRKELVEKYQSEEIYIKQWKSSKIIHANTYVFSSEIITENGEKVRSKSEKIIADKLFHENIPYVYEPALFLQNGMTKSPDFSVLNVRTRKEYYWEHLGMLDDPEYATKNVKKINEYGLNGYVQGKNMIYTYEVKDISVDTAILDILINEYLK